MTSGGAHCVILRNGVAFPLVGLGTYKLTESNGLIESIGYGIEHGYRHIDTAALYNNEPSIAPASAKLVDHLDYCRKHPGEHKSKNVYSESSADHPNVKSLTLFKNVQFLSDDELSQNKENMPFPPIEEPKDKKWNPVLVVSKIPQASMGYDDVMKSVTTHLETFKISRADVMLLHWPGCLLPPQHPDNKKIRHESWRALEDLYADGVIRAIGVSNYTSVHMTDLIEFVNERKKRGDKVACLPHIHQTEFHVCCQQNCDDILKLCFDNDIVLTSCSTLGSHHLCDKVLKQPLVVEIAQTHNVTPADVCLRFALQRGFTIIPRSTKEERVKSNLEVLTSFCLSDSEIQSLNTLDADLHACRDPKMITH